MRKIINFLIRTLWIICAIIAIIIGIHIKEEFTIIPTGAIVLIEFFVICLFTFLAIVGNELFNNKK